MRLDQAVALRLDATDAIRAMLNGETVWEAGSAIVPLEATGGDVWNIDGYRVHAFYGSGTFEVTSIPEGASGEVEYLIVGGGGSGGQGGGGAGGGGGGGGVLAGTTTLTVGTYPVTVGAGGAAHSTTTTRGNAGGSSSFAGVTAAGGGAGARTTSGGAGSSGGGGGPNQAGGAGTVGQGYDGTAGILTGSSPNRTFVGGGGGGAGSAATTGDTSVQAGSGGDGVISTITGRSISYAGGGGGAAGQDASGGHIPPGAGGSDSGGHGGRALIGLPGATYRGGGGGGGGYSVGTATVGSAGGSGVVVIRYPHDADATAYVEPSQPAGWDSSDTYLRVSNQTTIVRSKDSTWDTAFTPYGCVAADGSLLLAYRNGSSHHSPGRTEIMRGYHRPYLWETPHWPEKPHLLITAPSGYDDVRDAKLLTLPNGNILIAYCVQDSADTDISHARVRISTDNGETFGAEIDPADGIPSLEGVRLVPQGPEVRDDGSIIMPTWGPIGSMPLLRSVDGGVTWSLYSDIGNGVEPEIIRGSDAGEWLAFYRDGASRSTDDGATWSRMTTDLAVTNWVKPVRSTATGNLVACIRNSAVPGLPPYVRLSTDDGATWSTPLLADEVFTDQNQFGAFIFERSPGVFTLIHAVAHDYIKCSLLQELP